jgi:hypothetical protein
MCGWADLAPILSGFTIDHIGGIVGHAHPPPAKDHLRRDARIGHYALLIYRSDYRCSHRIPVSGDLRGGDRLSDIELKFTCKAGGQRGANVRPGLSLGQEACRALGQEACRGKQLSVTVRYLLFALPLGLPLLHCLSAPRRATPTGALHARSRFVAGSHTRIKVAINGQRRGRHGCRQSVNEPGGQKCKRQTARHGVPPVNKKD